MYIVKWASNVVRFIKEQAFTMLHSSYQEDNIELQVIYFLVIVNHKPNVKLHFDP